VAQARLKMTNPRDMSSLPIMLTGRKAEESMQPCYIYPPHRRGRRREVILSPDDGRLNLDAHTGQSRVGAVKMHEHSKNAVLYRAVHRAEHDT